MIEVGTPVRTLAPDNPVFHLRRGRVEKVFASKTGGEANYHVRFDADGRVFGPFDEQHVMEIEEIVKQDGESQADCLAREFSPDFGCWMEEALTVYNAVIQTKAK